MVSIIVSSRDETLFNNFRSNVHETIGNIVFEIIQIYNPGIMSLSAAYNKGGKIAQYPFLAFAHEDILFHTPNWGNLLVKIFTENKNIGLAGVAGGLYKSFACSGWASLHSMNRMYMISSHYGTSYVTKLTGSDFQTTRFETIKTLSKHYFEENIRYEKVAALDGMLLMTTKDVFTNIRFDEINLKGFHCYDLDYSFQVRSKYDVVVAYNILIEHFSPGHPNKDWIESIKTFNKKWLNQLPANADSMKVTPNIKAEYLALENYMRLLWRFSYGIAKSVSPLFDFNFIKVMKTSWLIIYFKFNEKFLQLLFKKIKHAK